jgi:capsular exopolysaccharide synthesis family protein
MSSAAVASAGSGLIDGSGRDSEPFRGLRLFLDLRRNERRGNALLVTSPRPGDGKTTVAANFALTSALTPRAVLLLDADLFEPTIHQHFGIPRSPGLVDLLREPLTIEELVYRATLTTGILDILSAGSVIRRTGDVVASHQMAGVIDRASRLYDLVVIDSPPVLEMSDATAIAALPSVDTLVVIDAAERRRKAVAAVRQLERTGANLLGLIINRDKRVQPPAYGG